MRAGLTPDNGRLRLYGSTSRRIVLDQDTNVSIQSLSDAEPLTGEDWIVAQFAYLGNEFTRTLGAKDYARRTEEIMGQFYSLISKTTSPKVIFSSSGAIYKEDRSLISSLEEHPYGYMKVKHEISSIEHTEAVGGSIIVPRIFNIGGTLGNKTSLYAMASMIEDALGGKDITIKAKAPTFRSYVDVEELVTMLVASITSKEQVVPQRFDTAGMEVVEMSDLADAILSAVGRPGQTKIRTFDGAAPASWYVGDGKAYQIALRRLGIQPQTLRDIIRNSLPN